MVGLRRKCVSVILVFAISLLMINTHSALALENTSPEISSSKTDGEASSGENEISANAEEAENTHNPNSDNPELTENEADESDLPDNLEDSTGASPETVVTPNASSPTTTEQPTIKEEASPYMGTASVAYSSHVAGLGWQPWVKDGAMAGTTGRALSMEALSIKTSDTDPNLTGSIEYSAHISGIGWQPWVKDGAMAGTTGRAIQMEALCVRLSGDLAVNFDIYYRVHCASLGWLDWAKNGISAGSSGYAYGMQAIEIRIVPKGSLAPGTTGTPFLEPVIAYDSHISGIGWKGYVFDGATAGTTGQGRPLEALVLRVSNQQYSGTIQCNAHVAGIGWQGWRDANTVSGTTGQSRQMEAVQIRLTGEMALQYDVYYRVHSGGIGWLDWAKNSETAGLVGFSCRMEALQVTLVQSGGPAPGATVMPTMQISYGGQGYIAQQTWLPEVVGQQVVGTTGQFTPLEGFKLKASSIQINGSIEYRAHITHVGWQGWIADGSMAGTTEGLRVEAVQIRLTGQMAQYFDVYYRAHIAGYGWLDWAKNGASAGTTKVGIALEGFQVMILAKSSVSPGPMTTPYFETLLSPAEQYMNARISNVYSPTEWIIAIDSANCIVGVYRGYQGNWKNVFFWPCSPGAAITPTVKGIYSIGSRGYSFGSGYTCYYWTQFYGDYLFHSILYYPGTRIPMEGIMGVPASHGCVRLDIGNAQWIYENIPSRTTVLSY